MDCGIDLDFQSVALGYTRPDVRPEDTVGFWIDANVVLVSNPPLLTDEQRTNFTEVAIEYRLPKMSRSDAYRFIAVDARYYGLNDYAVFLESKAEAAEGR